MILLLSAWQWKYGGGKLCMHYIPWECNLFSMLNVDETQISRSGSMWNATPGAQNVCWDATCDTWNPKQVPTFGICEIWQCAHMNSNQILIILQKHFSSLFIQYQLCDFKKGLESFMQHGPWTAMAATWNHASAPLQYEVLEQLGDEGQLSSSPLSVSFWRHGAGCFGKQNSLD